MPQTQSPCSLLLLPPEIQQAILTHLLLPYSLRAKQQRIARQRGDLGAAIEGGSYKLGLKIFTEQQQDLLTLSLTCKELRSLVQISVATYNADITNYNGQLKLRNGFPKYISTAVISIDELTFPKGLKLAAAAPSASTEKGVAAHYDDAALRLIWLRESTKSVSLPYDTRSERYEVLMSACRLKETFPNLRDIVLEFEPLLGDRDDVCYWELCAWQTWVAEIFDFDPRYCMETLRRQSGGINIVLRLIIHHTHNTPDWDLSEREERYVQRRECDHTMIAIFKLDFFEPSTGPGLTQVHGSCIQKQGTRELVIAGASKDEVSQAPPRYKVLLPAQRCRIRSITDEALINIPRLDDRCETQVPPASGSKEPSKNLSKEVSDFYIEDDFSVRHDGARGQPLPHRRGEDGRPPFR